MEEKGKFDTSDLFASKAIVDPPKIDHRDLPTKKIRYIIDSRDRNTALYPNPAKYSLKLDEGLTDVVKAELTVSDFKFNNYNVNSNNCVLHATSGEYTLPSGRYDGPALAQTLTEITPFTVTYNSVRDKLSFTSASADKLLFKSDTQRQFDQESFIDAYRSKSVGRVLGFDIADYELAPGSALEAPYRISLSDENFIVMYMRQAKVYFSQNNKVHNCFAILNKSETSTHGLIMHGGSDSTTSKGFRPPIPNLSTLAFKFTDYDGNLYDFQNKEHRFEIVFTCLRQTRCYNEIFN